MSFYQKTPKDIRKMREAGRLVAEAFLLLEKYVQPGAVLADLDKITEDFILSRGAAPLYKGYNANDPKQPPFPGTICASVNEEICHGIPDQRVLRDGDIIGIDIGLRLDEFCGDACKTFAVGNISEDARRLMDVAEKALEAGIEAVTPRGFMNDIGEAIQSYTESQGCSVVREWGGHGIGRNLHEPPSVSHYRQPTRGLRFRPGLVFTIEPMINLGTHAWKMMPDKWTVKTADGRLSAQFEHTIAVKKNEIEILTLP